MARQGIEPEHVLDERRQRVEALAHIGRRGGEEHFDPGAEAQHADRSSRVRIACTAATSCAGTRISSPLGNANSIGPEASEAMVTGRKLAVVGDACLANARRAIVDLGGAVGGASGAVR